ncbi:MAG TPA: tetratricopeptide repeat protein [Flavipsychrobacter sp.]|nr:tetratricopeptide repeat protein [Flavipsychrobacter sp.]
MALACTFHGMAQTAPISQARAFTAQKEYGKAIEIYKKLYEATPLDNELYNEYLLVLIDNKDLKAAEKLAENQLKLHPYDPLKLLDLGRIYLLSGKENKAGEQFDKAISMMNGDDLLTTRMANQFSGMKKDDYAIKTYERAAELLRNPFIYSNSLALLYNKTGQTEKAVSVLLEAGPRQMAGVDDTKSTLLEMFGNDPRKLQQAQKAIIKKINENPTNNFYSELLTWFYTQKNDWEGALIQIQALDERNKENGQRLLAFAGLAKKEKKYEVAVQALNAITEQGKEQPLYANALAEKLDVEMTRLEEDISFKKEDITRLQKSYEQYFIDFPQFYGSEILLQYARLEAQYAGNITSAVELLQKAITQPSANRVFVGRAKLQLGDYFLLQEKVWDASLTYSQVDKAFREDILGEEARFRNAKLAYYRGDFKWAQEQLDVLKASTSELIANDALYLSVLITENIPADSNLVPLRQYAHADLLLFQNKDKEAILLLDSISRSYPQHPLSDDILMLRAALAVKHREYEKALGYYKTVFDTFGQDVLGDDAVFKTAELYEKYLKQPAEAKRFYEELIIKYPGSTYVQVARMKLAENAVPPL